jgi:hypothetical protein
MKIPFCGGAYEGYSKANNAQQSINMYNVIDNLDGKEISVMYGTPGLKLFCDTGIEKDVRALYSWNNLVYAVVGEYLYSIDKYGSKTLVATLSTDSTPVNFADNGLQLIVVDSTQDGYIINTSNVATKITSSGFPYATRVVFHDGYFIVTTQNTGQIHVSKAYDGLTWDALDFATAEASPDNLVGIGTTQKHIWLMGEETTEVWGASGDPDFPFSRIPGAVLDIGCSAIASMTEINGVLYWLTNKNFIVKSDGYSYATVSPDPINYQISTYDTKSDAMSYTYTMHGIIFYVISFYTEGKTWVLNTGSGAWHEWATLYEPA